LHLHAGVHLSARQNGHPCAGALCSQARQLSACPAADDPGGHLAAGCAGATASMRTISLLVPRARRASTHV